MNDFFWLHIKKSGGTSIRKALGDRYHQTNRSNPKPFIALPRNEWNDALNNYKLPLGEYDYKRMLFAKNYLYKDDFNSMFKFIIVRNPYDRAVSSWLYCTKNSRKWKILNRLNSKKSFQVFLENLPEIWESKVDRHTATHTRQVYSDITDNQGGILIDYYAKVENIENDFKVICNKLGIKEREFPQENSVGRKLHYSKFYNKRSKELVEKYYKNDIDFFDYTF